MSLVFFLAWVDEGVAFAAGTHATTATKIWDGISGGEIVFSLALEHNEGEFPSLVVELINPRVGLLSAGRSQWVWLSADQGAGALPLFNGRIIGVPENLADEVLRVEFVARPPDFVAQKAALAAGLRVLPYVDPAFLEAGVDDPDTVLEARTLRWHIDPVSLAVTASDIVTGEAGTIEIGAAAHLYDGVSVSYGDPPLRRVAITVSAEWPQKGSGDVDLTRQLCAAAVAGGSPYPEPFFATLTGEGFLGDYPAPLTDIGGGWSMAASSSIAEAPWLQPKAYVVQYGDRTDQLFSPWQFPAMTPLQAVIGGGENLFQGGEPFPGTSANPRGETPPADVSADPFGSWEAAFPLSAYKVGFVVHYDANRDRSETVTGSLEADLQSLVVEPGADEQDTVELSSSIVGEPIDPGGALPIGDLRRNSYFKTDRGRQSWEYGLLLAAAKIIRSARAVELGAVTPWATADGITCRHNAHVVDYRLPAGEATGKVIGYKRSASGEGEAKAEIKIGCTIGYGVALDPAAAGSPVYVEDGVLEDGIQARTGAEVALVAGVLHYQSFDEFEVVDDDGVDLLNMIPATVVRSLTLAGGIAAQKAAIDAALRVVNPDPVNALEQTPSEVTLELVEVEGGRFRNDFAPELSMLVVPQTINLEAA